MGLSQQQQSILDKAKFGEGGISFISDISKVDIGSQPSLVVGLGGTGINAMLRVKAKINETFKTGINSNTGKRKTTPDNVKFIGIDTDSYSFIDYYTYGNHFKYNGFFVEETETLNIGSKTLSSFLKYAFKHEKTYITDWVNPSLADHDAFMGVGGIRQMARLCLFEKYESIYRKFLDIIRELVNRFPNFGILNVYVLSGLTGGTGSGIFIDIPYIIQKVVKDVLGIPENQSVWGSLVLIGCFTMPDVDIHRFDGLTNFMKANGYAALKELDYLMGLEERDESFEQQYTENHKICSHNRPYSVVNFVSGWFENGIPVEDPYDTALNVIAESILPFISGDL